MVRRKEELAVGEIYHIFNRGTDKRKIFIDQNDINRFMKSIIFFNSTELTGDLRSKIKNIENKKTKTKPLVNFIAYNLLPNHFHFILEQVEENGISKFMKRLQGGYSWYFNHKHKRSGSLFQGPFKSKLVDSNEYLLHLSAYVNLNNKQKPSPDTPGDQVAESKLGRSSWDEYLNLQKIKTNICKKKNIILEQFKTTNEYKKFALSSLEDMKNNKEKYKELE